MYVQRLEPAKVTQRYPIVMIQRHRTDGQQLHRHARRAPRLGPAGRSGNTGKSESHRGRGLAAARAAALDPHPASSAGNSGAPPADTRRRRSRRTAVLSRTLAQAVNGCVAAARRRQGAACCNREAKSRHACSARRLAISNQTSSSIASRRAGGWLTAVRRYALTRGPCDAFQIALTRIAN
jgi:hypothetical protein